MDSCILQFSPKSTNCKINFPWRIGNELIPTAERYTHLGIEIHEQFKAVERISNACRKAKNSYFALNGITLKSTNPTVLIKLYKTVILPTLLYGCEMWTSLKASDETALQRFQHFAIKRILGLPRYTRSYICQSIVGIYPITAYIDKRKLLFFQKLCCMDHTFLSKKIFLTRLFSYLVNFKRKHFGFIPDIVNILTKYELLDYLIDYISDGLFPNKPTWKIIVNCAIDKEQTQGWRQRIESDSDFSRFRQLHNSIQVAPFIRNAKSFIEIQNSLFICKLWSTIPNSSSSTSCLI